jgi:hypothetical protein
MGTVLGDINVRKNDRAAVIKEMIEAARPKAIFIVEFVHRYWKPTDLLIWFYRYLTTSIEKVRGKPTEYGDYTEAIKTNHRTVKLTFHAFTTREARRLFANQGFQTRIEKRAKFLHDWFIVVATAKSKINKVP